MPARRREQSVEMRVRTCAKFFVELQQGLVELAGLREVTDDGVARKSLNVPIFVELSGNPAGISPLAALVVVFYLPAIHDVDLRLYGQKLGEVAEMSGLEPYTDKVLLLRSAYSSTVPAKRLLKPERAATA
jgi:hypothetical protein